MSTVEYQAENQEKLYFLLKESFLLLDFGDRQLFSQFDLTAPRYYALVHLSEAPGISLKQLSDKMFCDKSNATRIVKGLEMDGYVQRSPHESDGRTYRLYLTSAGENIRATVAIAHQQFNENRLSILNTTQQGNLIEMLTALNLQLQGSWLSLNNTSN